jgi:hypothetical protein
MQPIMMETNFPIAANSTVSNVLGSINALRRYARSPITGKGIFMCSQSAAGLQVSVSHGSQEVINAARPRVGTDLQYPNDAINEDFYIEMGEMITISVTNTTAGALDFLFRMIIEPLTEDGSTPAEGLQGDSLVMQQGPVAIPNGTVSLNLLADTKYVRPPMDSILTILATSSAAGLLREIYVDTENISPQTAMSVANRIPLNPFDVVISGVEAPQDKEIALVVSNQSGGALNVFWRTVLKQLGRR